MLFNVTLRRDSRRHASAKAFPGMVGSYLIMEMWSSISSLQNNVIFIVWKTFGRKDECYCICSDLHYGSKWSRIIDPAPSIQDRLFSQEAENFLRMFIRFDIFKCFFDQTLFINNISCPVNPIVLLAHKLLGTPDTINLADLMIFIR